MREKTDAQLVELSKKDPEIFGVLIERYERKLMFYIKRILNVNDAEAEDLLQEIFIKIYQNLNAFDKDLKFSSWIYRISHNYAVSYYRKHKNETEKLSLSDSQVLFNNLKSDFDVKQDVEKRLLKEKVSNALGKLDYKYREVLVLKYLEDKDYREISDIIKKPMGSVATFLNRAKRKFKEILIQNNLTH